MKNPFELASKYTGITVKKLREIYNNFNETGEVKERESRRGRFEREKHWSRHWISNVREIVLRLNREGMPVTVKRIQKELNLAEYNLKISDRTIAKLLKEIGFQYADTSKAQNFVETPDIAEWRSRYLQERMRIRQLAEKGEVYEVWLDESYCNQHHVASKSWFREGDTVKRGNKGRRWVIVHAGGRDGWCGVPKVFEASSKSNDYHDNMDSRIFEEYFRGLCEALLEEGNKYRKIIFHMDNARYHKRIDGLPRCLSSLRKDELKEWLLSKGAKPEQLNNLKRKQLYELARDKPEYKGTPVVEKIAAEYGFEINWLPPYHPTLNPIEEAWGITKGYVAWHNDGKKFEAVKDMISQGFKKVTKDIWTGLVRRTYANEDAFITKLHILTATDINDMIIALDVDSDQEDEQLTDEFAEELMFEDIIEIHDNEDFEEGEGESEEDGE